MLKSAPMTLLKKFSFQVPIEKEDLFYEKCAEYDLAPSVDYLPGPSQEEEGFVLPSAVTFQFFLKDDEAEESALVSLKESLSQISTDLTLPTPTFHSEWIDEKVLLRKWEDYFHPLPIGSNLLICPYKNPDSPPPENPQGRQIIWLDPGCAFGSGGHATTASCLKLIDQIKGQLKKSDFICDAGCGTGILTLALAAWGFTHLFAFDNDPEAVESTRNNLTLNNIGGVEVELFSLENIKSRFENRFSLITANVAFPVLLITLKDILSCLAPGGYLILSGILIQNGPKIIEAALIANLPFEVSILEENQIEEWTTLLFQRGNS